MVLVDTHANPDAHRDNLAPDISVYAADNVPDDNVKTDFSKMELFVELKFAKTSDPFRDPKEPGAKNFRFENDSEVSQLNRGQLCSYAAAHAGSQFRVHTFTLSICGRSARFIRWDRSGATVTRSFDYIEQPDVLAHFFWRYAHLNHSQRGYDTSVSQASPEDLQQIRHVEQRLRDDNLAHREFRIIMVPDRDVPKVETPFIISFPPKYTARSPFGRATRPMLAFNMETREIVFLKDYWRADVDGMEKEGDIYALLESKSVPNIAPFGKGNDVRDHTTLTHTLRNEEWACQSRVMVLLSQYRMSLDVVARHLVSFKSSKEFVSAIADAMEGKISFADSNHITNFSPPQHINMPISTLMSFIAISVRVTS
jgi:Fungal protein kinase